jgi:hypothetical protein
MHNGAYPALRASNGKNFVCRFGFSDEAKQPEMP